MLLTRLSNFLVAVAEAVNVLVAVAVAAAAAVDVAVAEAVNVLVAVIVPPVILSKIKYERSSSFLAKSFLAKMLFCSDFVICLRCFGYEK